VHNRVLNREQRKMVQMHNYVITTWINVNIKRHSNICHQHIKAIGNPRIKQNICETILTVKTEKKYSQSLNHTQLALFYCFNRNFRLQSCVVEQTTLRDLKVQYGAV